MIEKAAALKAPHEFSQAQILQRGDERIEIRSLREAVERLKRISKPGLRSYNGVSQIQPVLNGLGVTILTTSKGILSSREAKAQNVGGEVLCEVW